jgi:hypothetical protein
MILLGRSLTPTTNQKQSNGRTSFKLTVRLLNFTSSNLHCDVGLVKPTPPKLCANLIDRCTARFAPALAEQIEHKERFVINRSFAAPIDVMYDM